MPIPEMRLREREKLAKVIGERMKAARELCGLSQRKASQRLGYVNSSKLAKIEGDIDSIPLWLIPKAAKVYGVSTDFLFGLSDRWERDPVVSQERQLGQWLEDHWKQMKETQDNAIRALHAKQAELTRTIDRTLRRSKENLECLTRVQELNPEFNEMRLGAKLLRLLAETAEDAMGLGFELEKLRMLSEAEHLMEDIESDTRHPAIDPKHPDHERYKTALGELKSNLNQSRARRGF